MSQGLGFHSMNEITEILQKHSIRFKLKAKLNAIQNPLAKLLEFQYLQINIIL